MDLAAGHVALVAGLAMLPAALQLWWGRSFIRTLAEPALAERLLAFRKRRLLVTVTAGAGLVALDSSAAWWALPVLVFASMVAAYPLRRAMYDETWSLAGYLRFFVGLIVGLWGFWVALAVAPVVIMNAGQGSWSAALLVGSVLAGWNLAYGPLLRALIGATPMPPGPIRDDFEKMVATAQLPPVRLEQVALRGGVLANAMALPSLAGPAVLVSSTLVERLDLWEVRAILAHELAHIEHYTPRRLRRRWLAITALTLVGMTAPLFLETKGPDVGSVMAILWPIVVLLSIVALQRHRQAHETESDRRAVALCGDAASLMRALEKIHATGLIARRWAVDHERKASHPSLARRLRDIAALADEPSPPFQADETVTAVDGSATATFQAERLAWREGTVSEFTLVYGQLSSLRVQAAARTSFVLEAVDRAGRRWTLPLAAGDVSRVQATLDRIDWRLAGPSADDPPVDPAFIRVAAWLCASISACGGLISLALAALVAAIAPTPALLWASIAAATGGTVLCWIWPTLLPRNVEWVAFAIPATSAVMAAAAWTNRKRTTFACAPQTAVAYAALAIVALGLAASGGLSAFALRANVTAWPSAVVLPLAAAVMVAAATPRPAGAIAAIVLTLLSTALAGLGTRTYVDRAVTDAFVSRDAAMRVPRASDTPQPSWSVSGLPEVEELWVAPHGQTFAYQLASDDSDDAIEVRTEAGVVRRLDGSQAAYVDDETLAVVVSTDTTSLLRVVEIASGRERWHAALPSSPAAFVVEPSGRWRMLAEAPRGDLVFATALADGDVRVQRWSRRAGPAAVLSPLLVSDRGLLAIGQRYDTDRVAPWFGPVFAAASHAPASAASLWWMGETSTEDVRSALELNCVPNLLEDAAVCAAFDGVDTHLSRITASATPAVGPRVQGKVEFYSDSGAHVRAWLGTEPVIVDATSLAIVRAPRTRDHRPYLVAGSQGAMVSVGTGGGETSARVYAR